MGVGVTSDLYHWTCAHSAVQIRNSRTVQTHYRWSWWTDIATPGQRMRAATGLTSNLLGCDRTEYRCTAADPRLLQPWTEHREQVDLDLVLSLEGVPGARPDRWWVALTPVPVSSVRRMRPGVLA